MTTRFLRVGNVSINLAFVESIEHKPEDVGRKHSIRLWLSGRDEPELFVGDEAEIVERFLLAHTDRPPLAFSTASNLPGYVGDVIDRLRDEGDPEGAWLAERIEEDVLPGCPTTAEESFADLFTDSLTVTTVANGKGR